MNSPFIYIFA